MGETQLNSRFQLRNDSDSNWTLSSASVPLKGEPIIYNRDNNNLHTRMKIGDGVTPIGDLPFFGEEKLDKSELNSAIEDALEQAKTSGEFDGANGVSATHSWNGTILTMTSASGTSSADLKGDKGDTGGKGDKGDTGPRGMGLLAITTAPSSYTTPVNGLTPTYRISLSTVKTQASVSEVYAGDTILYSYYHYPIIYVDSSYVYCKARVSIRGATGAAGTTPVKGTDYYTEADKTEMIGLVTQGLPVIELIAIDKDGVSYRWNIYGEQT